MSGLLEGATDRHGRPTLPFGEHYLTHGPLHLYVDGSETCANCGKGKPDQETWCPDGSMDGPEHGIRVVLCV